MMDFDSRRTNRVRMDHKQSVNLMGSDGTWRRRCVLLDVPNTGARIEVEGTLDVLQTKEFFMLLSSTGLAFRRCELVWIDGTTAGVHFVAAGGKPKPASKKTTRASAQRS